MKTQVCSVAPLTARVQEAVVKEHLIKIVSPSKVVFRDSRDHLKLKNGGFVQKGKENIKTTKN